MSNIIYGIKLPHYSAAIFEKRHIEFFHVDFSHVDASGRASVAALTGFLQETAWQHANRLHIGYYEMLQQNTAFVINKLLIKMRRLPRWNEMLSVETWLHPPEKVQALREFTIRDNSRNLIAAASISYIAINTQTRKLSQVPAHIKHNCIGEDFLDEKPQRISTDARLSETGLVVVKPSDIDMNRHVNNSRYMQWVFDHLPEAYRIKISPASVSINFLHEVCLGDEICICCSEKAKSLILNGVNKNKKQCVFWAEIKYR